MRKRAKRKEEWTGPLICLSGVDVVYNTGTEALKNCNLKVEKGEFVFVVGSSGSGKSTLIKSLLGEIPLQAGEIQVGGNSLTEMKRKRMPYYRRKLGVVFQEFRLLDDRNVFENVALAQQVIGVDKDRIEKNVRGMLQLVGLQDRADVYPRELSGGEQQRVAIAIALANNPKILLADEPTGAVDSKTSDMIQDLFRKLNEEMGITVIIVTHDISLANKVGRVVMIADGKISTEKIMKEDYRKRINDMESESFNGTDSHEEYSIMDKAHRVQISDDILEAAGIDTNKVKIQVVDGKVVISKE